MIPTLTVLTNNRTWVRHAGTVTRMPVGTGRRVDLLCIGLADAWRFYEVPMPEPGTVNCKACLRRMDASR